MVGTKARQGKCSAAPSYPGMMADLHSANLTPHSANLFCLSKGCVVISNYEEGTKEMAQQLSTLVALTEDPGSFPSALIGANSHL